MLLAGYQWCVSARRLVHLPTSLRQCICSTARYLYFLNVESKKLIIIFRPLRGLRTPKTNYDGAVKPCLLTIHEAQK